MLKILIRTAAVAAVALAAVSCASLIEGKPIEGADFDLLVPGADAPGALPVANAGDRPGTVTAVVPYATYTVRARALVGSKWRQASPYGDYSVLTTEDFTCMRMGEYPWEWSVSAAANPFALLSKDTLEMSVVMASEPPLTVTRSFSVDLTTVRLPSFRGADGVSPGLDGQDGPTLEFEMAGYDVRGTVWESLGEAILLREKRTNRWFLLPVSRLERRILTIDVSGGNGATGQKGQGMLLATGQTGTVYGGPGGAGGRGGRGGLVIVRTQGPSPYAKMVSVWSFGGAGGPGGPGGSGASTEKPSLLQSSLALANGRGVWDGDKGRDGNPGSMGSSLFETGASLDSMFLGLAPAGFDRSRLIP